LNVQPQTLAAAAGVRVAKRPFLQQGLNAAVGVRDHPRRRRRLKRLAQLASRDSVGLQQRDD
jgi:hypothetical protein